MWWTEKLAGVSRDVVHDGGSDPYQCVMLWVMYAVMCRVQVLKIHNLDQIDIEVYKGMPLVSPHLTKIELSGIELKNCFLNFSSCPALKELYFTKNCGFDSVYEILSRYEVSDDSESVLLGGLTEAENLKLIAGPNIEYKSMVELETEENDNPLWKPAAISEHLKVVKVHCKEVDEGVYKIGKWLSTLDKKSQQHLLLTHPCCCLSNPSSATFSNISMSPLHTHLGFFLLLLLFSLHNPSCSAAANDTLAAGQVLAVGEKLVSRNGKFALGFYKPALPEGIASKYGNITSPGWYLAIWFNKIPVCTTVWVANRERPITDLEIKLTQLKFSQNGSSLAIIINRATEYTVWSRQIANRTAQAKTSMNTSAILLDSGNLVIESIPDVYLWQSFDEPTDLALPGAKFGWNKVTRLHRTGISKKNLIDPGLGPYSVQLNERGIILWRRDPYMEYWTWSSVQLTNMLIPLLNSLLEMNAQTKGFLTPNYTNNNEEEYFMYHSSDESSSSFVSIDMSGQLKLSIWSQANQSWQEVYAQPPDPCTPFATCGPFSVCNGNSDLFCDCMESFSQKSPQDWELKDRTAGCFRNTPLDCPSNKSSTDMFHTITRVALPANPKKIEDATTQSKCAESCLSNCSCNAYAYKDSTCFVWHSELLNVKLHDSIESLSEDTLYLRLAAKDMPATTKNKQKPVVVAVTAASIAGFGLLMLMLFFLIWRNKFKCCGVTLHHNQGNSGIIAFRYTDLSHATKNFSEKLGSGGFGSVFKGVLRDSTTIAVKRLDGSHQGEKQFRAEVSSLGLIQHINLVKLIGFCCEGDKRLLVYEHMVNGSLDAHLFHSNGAVLDWNTRHQIAIGVARGLSYLHESCRECIIHCDIKPENILLEASFAPKIADFGMAAFVGRDFSRVLTTFRGTKGYLAPEWLSGVAITPKVDVYSFGMVLLEIISGRRNLSEAYTSNHYHFDYFPVQAISKLHEGSVQNLLDPELHGDFNLEEAERVCKVACWCIQEDEIDRPTMGEVVRFLEGLQEVDMPPMPRLLAAITESLLFEQIESSNLLAVGEKLISRNGKFALGFFKPTLPEDAGSKYKNIASPGWYLAIWFNEIPVCTTVWVANRERPIADHELKLAQLKFSQDGSSLAIIINRATESTAWSTQIANRTAQAKTSMNTSEILLDSGNLVIESLPDVYLWQSFDDATNLVLPGAKLGWNKVTGLHCTSISKKNLIDPGLSSYSVQLNERGIVLWRRDPYMKYLTWSSTLMSGQLKLSIWSQANQYWQEVYAHPTYPCASFATCGPFSFCIATCGPFGVCDGNRKPFCDCMEGFSPKSPQDWELMDRTAGCFRNTPLDCSSNRSSTDMFLAIGRGVLPTNHKRVEDATTQSKCEEACLSNCSCIAYAYEDSTCYAWHGELLNLRLQDSIESLSEDTLYLRLAAKDMPASTKNKRKPFPAAVTIASIIGFGLLMLLLLFLIWQNKLKCRGVPLHHTQGSSGIGVLSDSTTIVVKRLDGLHQGEKQFRAEMRSLRLIQHINLVKLIGFCYEDDKRLLVYEHMINGPLDAHLFHSNGAIIDWSTRHQIAIGVARGLSYLHESCHECIIHCDIKPENILVEASFAPKIADFGMAAFVGRDFSRVLTTFRGTKGYLAPEWLSGVAITPKVDVYSFGMKSYNEGGIYPKHTPATIIILIIFLCKPSANFMREVCRICLIQNYMVISIWKRLKGFVKLLVGASKKMKLIGQQWVKWFAFLRVYRSRYFNIFMPPLYRYLGLLLAISLHTPSCSTANDTLAAGQVLVVSEKLISRNGKFALGFFKPALPEGTANTYGNVTSPGWYLAIWFNNIPVCTTVWVANRERPITEPELKLVQMKISEDGSSLVIINHAIKSIVWSTQITNGTAQAKTGVNTSAILLDSGNLVIESLPDVYLWQSFDYPTDLVLPGAKIGWNKVTGLCRTCTSKKNLIDPGLGSYSVQLNSRGIILWHRDPYIEYWTWSSIQMTYTLMPLLNSLLTMNSEARGFLTPTYVNNDEEEYLMYHSSDESSSSFVSIDMSGQVKLNIWSQANQSWAEVHAEPWAQVYAQPPDPCTPFATCGPFGICNGNSEQFCDCMESFSQKSPQDWKLKDRSASCIRNTPLDCPSNRSSTDMFQTIARVTLPANPEKLEDATTQSKCAEVCLSNCSCNAYAYKDSVCSVWHSELLNVKLRDNIESLSEDTLYLRLAAKDMPASTKNKRKPVIAVVTTASIVGFGLLMLVMFFLIWRIKFNCCGVPLHHNQGNSGIIAFKYTDLSHATKNFSQKLGSGGFGSVFKGVLSDSTTIAVKRLDGLHQGEKQFRAEVSSLGLIHHINLVKLIGFCYEGDKRLLVYERMINGSLDAHLFHSNGTILDWSTRHQIAIGVARGLFYLHESCHKCIIHCDIKPENILLEASFAPKIADFGMAAFVGRDFSRVLTSFRGTKGYLAPEWLSGVAITPKVDVYSFGMVLLEIISGRRNLSEAYTSKHYHFDYFPMQAMSKLHGGSVQDLLDPKLNGDFNLEEAERICKVACWCIQENEFDRPTMGEVVHILEGLQEVEMPPTPRLFADISEKVSYAPPTPTPPAKQRRRRPDPRPSYCTAPASLSPRAAARASARLLDCTSTWSVVSRLFASRAHSVPFARHLFDGMPPKRKGLTSKKMAEAREEGGIDVLPDALLQHILSFLSADEAVKTSASYPAAGATPPLEIHAHPAYCQNGGQMGLGELRGFQQVCQHPTTLPWKRASKHV
uniref:non-specific serine/threonine protein kinase n=1 Tax=Oryza rufipogon TaxID=4529 RepID=A0A0E0R5M4_ORYRU